MLVKKLKADIVYIDPPYNSRQYSSAYHLLENLTKWEKPRVFGTTGKSENSSTKSEYCTKSATSKFRELIKDINTKYIILSYNNMRKNGSPRSQSIMDDSDILSILQEKGEVSVYEKDFKQFNAGKSTKDDLKERVFICKVNNQQAKGDYIKSFLNYTGGKYKLLPQLSALFPKNINTLYDVFGGGGDLSLNIKAKKIVYIDTNEHLVRLFNFLQKTDFDSLNVEILKIIKKYKLSNTSIHEYEYYGCCSSKGLSSYNKDRFLKLRIDFNTNSFVKDRHIKFLVLLFYAFNNQIRFNSKGEYNLPVGKRDYNENIKKNLRNFYKSENINKIVFKNKSFLDLHTQKFNKDDFIYLDPPYLLGLASYNESGGWDESKERSLYDLLFKLNERGIKFALSNVIEHKGKENKILKRFAKENELIIHKIKHNYNNSNYQSKSKLGDTQEVLVTNY